MRNPTVYLKNHYNIVDNLPCMYSEIYHGAVELVEDMYVQNDFGHSIEHAKNVAIRAYYYASQSLYMQGCLGEILVAGIMHDIHSQHRAEHHSLAAEDCLNHKPYLQFFDKYYLDKHAIAMAVLHHRASGPTINWAAFPVSDYIASADRRINVTECLDVMLGTDLIVNEEKAQHVFEKFNPNTGYAYMPPMVKKHRYSELCQMYILASSTINVIRALKDRRANIQDMETETAETGEI